MFKCNGCIKFNYKFGSVVTTWNCFFLLRAFFLYVAFGVLFTPTICNLLPLTYLRLKKFLGPNYFGLFFYGPNDLILGRFKENTAWTLSSAPLMLVVCLPIGLLKFLLFFIIENCFQIHCKSCRFFRNFYWFLKPSIKWKTAYSPVFLYTPIGTVFLLSIVFEKVCGGIFVSLYLETIWLGVAAYGRSRLWPFDTEAKLRFANICEKTTKKAALSIWTAYIFFCFLKNNPPKSELLVLMNRTVLKTPLHKRLRPIFLHKVMTLWIVNFFTLTVF